MGKRKSKKKNIKKQVKKRAQKLKELTAEDLLMNPALLQSPQFKALPLEKQFQLTTQLKQLKTYGMASMRPMGMNVVGGKSDELYSKFLDTNSKLSQISHENQQLKQQIEANKQQIAEESRKKQELKKDQQDFKSQVKREEAMNGITRSFEQLDSDKQLYMIDQIGKQIEAIHNSPEGQNSDALKDLSKRFTAALANVSVYDVEKAQNYLDQAAAAYQRSVNKKLGKIETNLENIEKLKNDRAAYQNAANSLNQNGESEKADKAEHAIIDTTDQINDEKKNSMTAPLPPPDDVVTPNPYSDIPPPPDEEVQGASLQAQSAPPLPDTVSDYQNLPLIPQEQLDNDNAKLEAKQLILKDQVKIAQQNFEAKQQLQRAEELANMTADQNPTDLQRTQLMIRQKEALELKKKYEDMLRDDIEAARNLEYSDELKPFTEESQRKIENLTQQYSKETDPETKVSILNQLNHLQHDMSERFDEWHQAQDNVKKKVRALQMKQLEAGIKPNEDYAQGMMTWLTNTSPTKIAPIEQKLNNDTKQLDEGIAMMKQTENLYKKTIDRINDLQSEMIKHKIVDNGNQIKAWRSIANTASKSHAALNQVYNDLGTAIANTSGQKYRDVNVQEYVRKLQPLLNMPIDVSGFRNKEVFNLSLPEDLQRIMDMQPNNEFVFNFDPQKALNQKIPASKIPTVYYKGQNFTEYVKNLNDGPNKKLLLAMLYDGTKNLLSTVWNHGPKQIVKAACILGSAYLLFEVIPQTWTQGAAQKGIRFTLDLVESTALEASKHGLAIYHGAQTAIQPELAFTGQQLKQIWSSTNQYIEQAKQRAIKYCDDHRDEIIKELGYSEWGRNLLKTGDNFKKLLPKIMEASVDTINGILATCPALIKALGLTVKAAGAVAEGAGKVAEAGELILDGADKAPGMIKGFANRVLSFVGIDKHEGEYTRKMTPENLQSLAQLSSYNQEWSKMYGNDEYQDVVKGNKGRKGTKAKSSPNSSPKV